MPGSLGEAQLRQVLLDLRAQVVRVAHWLERELARRAWPGVGGADLAVELGAGLGGEAGALVDQGGGALGVEVAGAQLGGGALEALDDPVEGFRRHARRHSRARRAGPRRGCR